MGEHTFDDIDGSATHLEAMVSGVDVDTLTGEGAARLAQRLVTAERILAAARVRATKRAADANQWRHAGERSPAAWAARLTGTTPGQAAAELETTARLAGLPATDAARRTGSISELQAREITSAASADPAAEAELLRRARIDDAAAFKRRCAVVRAAAEQDEAAAHERIRRARRFRSWTDVEGAFCFAGRGTPEDGAALLAAMRPHQDRALHVARRRGEHGATETYAYDALLALARRDSQHHHPPTDTGGGSHRSTPAADRPGRTAPPVEPTAASANDAGATNATRRDPAPVPRTATGSTTARAPGAPSTAEPGHDTGPPGAVPDDTASARGRQRAASLADPGGVAASADADGSEGAVSPGSVRPGPRAKLIVRIDHAALLRGHTVPGEVCEIAGIGPIPVATARELARDAFLTAVAVDGTDITTVVHLGRAATTHQRTALEARSMACAVPGCGHAHGLEIDHVDGWAITRRTHIDQLDWLCAFHHKQKTHHSYRLAGPPGARTWHRPDDPGGT